MKRYNEIVFRAEQGIEYICEEKNGKMIATAVIKKAKEAENEEFFSKITSKEREEVSKWVKGQKFKTYKEERFGKVLKEALKEVNYDYWISNIEPSVDEETGKLIFVENKPVAVGYSCNQLKKMCEAYKPERGSRRGELYELFIWYAYRIVKGYWTLDFVANDSSSGGNYWNAPDATHCMEKTGARICGGFKDGQGNTYKVVTHKNGIAQVGGNFDNEGYNCPVSDFYYYNGLSCTLSYGSCVVVLTK